MFYTYVLFSEKDSCLYIGYTKDLETRFEKHEKGMLPSTKDRRPLKLIYYEACPGKKNATNWEKYLKTFIKAHNSSAIA